MPPESFNNPVTLQQNPFAHHEEKRAEHGLLTEAFDIVFDALPGQSKSTDGTKDKGWDMSEVAAGFIKSVPLFMGPGRGGTLLSAALHGLDEVHRGDSTGTQLTDFALGSGKGVATKLLMDKYGASTELSLARKGIVIGGGSSFVNSTLTRTNWINQTTGELDFTGGLQKTAFQTAFGAGVGMAAFPLGHALGSRITPHAQKFLGSRFDGAMVSAISTGGAFGLTGGVVGETASQLYSGSFDPLAIGRRGLLEGLSTAAAGGVGHRFSANYALNREANANIEATTRTGEKAPGNGERAPNETVGSEKTGETKITANEAGQLVNERGQLVNKRGQLINERNQVINEEGKVLDSKGNLIEKEFPNYPKPEYDRVRPKIVEDLMNWLSIGGNNVGKSFDALTKKQGWSEAEKNEVYDGHATVREHGARMKQIDPEQEINWKHTQREFGAAVEYAARSNMTKAETQDLLFKAMFSDGLKTKFNFTTHNVDGATAFEQFAKTNLPNMSPERIAGIKQGILEHQIAPPEFMAMIYGGTIMGSIKAEGRAMTEAETAGLQTLKGKISNPFALKESELIDVPGGPAGAKAIKLSEVEQALLSRTGLDMWYVPHEGNAWYKTSRALVDADGIDNYAGVGGLGKIIGLRGPEKASFFQDRHVLYGNPENPAEISSYESWKQSQRDFLGNPESGKLGVASEETRLYVEQQAPRVQQDLAAAQQRVNDWINSPAGRSELGLPAEGPIEKIPGWTGSKERPDLIDYSTATPESLSSARKIWDRFGVELSRQQRVDLAETPPYEPLMQSPE